ncbi:hypothetical protein [Pseudidiomarina tainanensis]|uniref:Uncharacterized protein n=1 Tax=Pseudidiomarina tainanensis TaxID=502365 RepID=A0ABX9HB18_9GAMM|nr:hypothetical protein [Pseudidiomarina tainanensis]RBP86284.1 hypothetical protein DFO81_1355 [Pseudidiomarina tainanensis]RBP91216.1 hypothetical protein DFO81_105167 [Pseudidiomarina tainanensis]
MIAIFRCLVILNLVLYWAYMFAPDLIGRIYDVSDDEFQALYWSGAGAAIEGNNVWFYGFLAIYTGLSAGLIAFQAWAKYLFIILVPVQLFLTLLFGVAVLLPWEFLVVSLMTYIDGFILCMLLFTSISTSFSSITRRSTTPPQAVAGRS